MTVTSLLENADAKHTTLRFHNGLEMKIGDGDGLRTRGALPKGTTRKCVCGPVPGRHTAVICAARAIITGFFDRRKGIACMCRVHKKYEEVFVPAMKKGEMALGEMLVKIREMPDWAQVAFEGYKCASFCWDQSKVFVFRRWSTPAFHSDRF